MTEKYLTKKHAVVYTLAAVLMTSIGVAFWFFAASGLQAALDSGPWPFFVSTFPVVLIVASAAFRIFAKWYVVIKKVDVSPRPAYNQWPTI